MITRYIRDRGQTYYNVIYLVWLFLVTEFLEFLKFFGAYDPSTNTINYRQAIWICLLSILIMGFYFVVMAACIIFFILVIGGLS